MSIFLSEKLKRISYFWRNESNNDEKRNVVKRGLEYKVKVSTYP